MDRISMLIKKILCSVGIHKYRDKKLPVTKGLYGALVLECSVCVRCGQITKKHKDYLNRMRAIAELSAEAFGVDTTDHRGQNG